MSHIMHSVYIAYDRANTSGWLGYNGSLSKDAKKEQEKGIYGG